MSIQDLLKFKETLACDLFDERHKIWHDDVLY